MAKQSGLGDNLYVDSWDLSGDIQALGTIHGGPKPWETTGIDKGALERIGTVRDGSIESTAFFNPAATRAHPVLSALPGADRAVTYCRGTLLGSPAASLWAKQIGYDGERGDDGSLTLAVEAASNGYGLSWGRLGTAGKRTDTAATNGASLNDGAASAFGLVAWLHVFAFTGDDITISIQSSSDNGVGDAFAAVTGGAFAQVTAVGSQRIATAPAAAIERYLRVVTSTVAGFVTCTFGVNIVRHLIATAY